MLSFWKIRLLDINTKAPSPSPPKKMKVAQNHCADVSDDSEQKKIEKKKSNFFPILLVLTSNMGKRHPLKTFFFYGA